MENKKFEELPTKHLTERHIPQLYSGAVDVVSGEFDASHRFQHLESYAAGVYDFVWLREPASRVVSQYEHHRAHGRFEDDQAEWDSLFLSLLDPTTCAKDELRHCSLLRDGDKCLGGGFCGVMRDHQVKVRWGACRGAGQMSRQRRRRPSADALSSTPEPGAGWRAPVSPKRARGSAGG